MIIDRIKNVGKNAIDRHRRDGYDLKSRHTYAQELLEEGHQRALIHFYRSTLRCAQRRCRRSARIIMDK